jgi:hypothetical protein
LVHSRRRSKRLVEADASPGKDGEEQTSQFKGEAKGVKMGNQTYISPGEKMKFWKEACLAVLRAGKCGAETACERADIALREMCNRFENTPIDTEVGRVIGNDEGIEGPSGPGPCPRGD